jgi:hypothetical protein
MGGPKAGLFYVALVACCLFSALAAVFRWGWLVPCVAFGMLFGAEILDPCVKGGTIDSQMQETVGHISCGTFLGLAIGGAVDAIRLIR